MFETIVVATDLSEASDSVIACLHGLRDFGARKVVLAHSVGVKYEEEIAHLLAQIAESKLASQRTVIEAQGFEVAVEVGSGTPMVEVNRIAKEHRAALIVVGSLGATLAREVLLGGAALAILHQAEIPVLIVRLRVAEPGAAEKCRVVCTEFTKHILFTTDFSDNAERAFEQVKQLVANGARRVTLLHVQDKTKIAPHLRDRLDEFNRIDQERLERLKGELTRQGATDVAIKIPYGSPTQEILRLAAEDEDTLIVMGSQGRGFISEVFLGSVSHNVARHAAVPVLIVPPIR
jgi:nucleotide-binding universal stress UspA family protein